MDNNFKIDLSLLRQAFLLLIAELESKEGQEIEVGDDYYWSIPACSRYDLTASPCAQGDEGLTIGQLTDDYALLETTVNNDEPVLPAFAWLGNIMLRLAETWQGKSVANRPQR